MTETNEEVHRGSEGSLRAMGPDKRKKIIYIFYIIFILKMDIKVG